MPLIINLRAIIPSPIDTNPFTPIKTPSTHHEDFIMADDTTEHEKTPEEKAANAKKKELRRLKADIKIVRGTKRKTWVIERKKLEERYNTLAVEMGLAAAS